MTEPKGIYATQTPGAAIYASNKRGNTIEIDLQTFDAIKDAVDKIKTDLIEAQELAERQAEAIRQRDALFEQYCKMEISYPTYIIEMQALMSSTSVTGGDER